MRADRVVATVLALSGGATMARAEGIYGAVQVQYQRSREPVVVVDPRSGPRLMMLTRSQWLQSWDVNHQDYLRSNMLLQSTFRLTRTTVPDRPDMTQAPQGSMRFIHPWINASLSHQPTRVVTSLSPGGAPADSLHAPTVVTHVRETLGTAHIAPPNLPQLDLSWVRRRREVDDGSPADLGRQRQARASWNRDRYGAYAAFGDQHQERGIRALASADQRLLFLGGNVRPVATRTAGVSLQYDLTDVRTVRSAGVRTTTRTSAATLSGEWRPTRRWNANLSGLWRRTQAPFLGAQNDGESAVLVGWRPLPNARLTSGGGVRTVTFSGRRALERYVTAIASQDGQPRPGWRTGMTLSHTLTWDPERGRFGVNTAATNSRMNLGRRAVLDGNWQLTSNGDTAVRAQRVAITWVLHTSLQPLRTLQLGAGINSQRIGEGILKPTGVVRGRQIDVTWRPTPGVDVTGNAASSGLLPDDAPRIGTRSLLVRVTPSARWQVTGTWTRSTTARVLGTTSAFAGREFASGRLQVAPTRRLAASVSLEVANPGRADVSRQFDTVVTWSFGR